MFSVKNTLQIQSIKRKQEDIIAQILIQTMPSSSSSSFFRYLSACVLLNLYFQSMAASTNLPFFFKNFGKDSNFESQLALYGDVMIAHDNMSLQIGGSGASRGGRIIYKKPINLVEINSGNLVSFSNYFVFNMSGERGAGGGLGFLMLPFGFPVDAFGGGGSMETSFLSVEFDATRTRTSTRDERESENHVGLNVGLELNRGEMLQAWIDYEASGKSLEVRLSKLGNTKPLHPLLSYPIDLGMMWKAKTVALVLSSSHMTNLYSWSFRPRTAPQWMHSEPVDPQKLMGKRKDVKVAKSDTCSLTTLFALILGVGFAALGGFLVLLAWTMLGHRRPVVPEEFAVPVKESDSKQHIGP